MRKPTPLHTRIEYEAGVDSIDGRKIKVWATSKARGEVVADCDALMVTPRHPLT
jgi:hypothetical protein